MGDSGRSMVIDLLNRFFIALGTYSHGGPASRTRTINLV